MSARACDNQPEHVVRETIMTRRRLLLFGVLAAITTVAMVALWLLSPPTAITRQNYDKICKGMSRAEVEAILGVPNQITDEPRLYTWFKVARGRPTDWYLGDRHLQPGPDDRHVETASWYSLEIRIEIDFDDNDCVCGTKYLFAYDANK
jgi:hypothetical protein